MYTMGGQAGKPSVSTGGQLLIAAVQGVSTSSTLDQAAESSRRLLRRAVRLHPYAAQTGIESMCNHVQVQPMQLNSVPVWCGPLMRIKHHIHCMSTGMQRAVHDCSGTLPAW